MPNERLFLSRDVLAKFLPDHQAIKAFERVFTDVSTTLPSTIEEAQMQAAAAMVVAQQALSALADLADAINTAPAAEFIPEDDPMPARAEALMEDAPAPARMEAEPPYDLLMPAQHLGTIASQDHDSVEITGGSVNLDAGTVMLPVFTLGGELTTGFYRIGPHNWGFAVIAGMAFQITNIGHFGIGVVPATRLDVGETGGTRIQFKLDSATRAEMVARDAADTASVPCRYTAASHEFINDLTVSTKFGCNGQAAQAKYTLGAAATDLASVITLANNIRTALINNGIGQA